jgi:hypothetical protein
MEAGEIYLYLGQFLEGGIDMRICRGFGLVSRAVFVLIVLFGTWSPIYSQCDGATKSSGIDSFLMTRYPDWKVVEVTDLSEYHRRLWLEDHPTACPGMDTGRFDPGGRWQTAILLIPKLQRDNRAKLLILSKIGLKYSSVVLANLDQRGEVPVIFTASRGRYRSWDHSVEIVTKYKVVTLVFYESSATVFYWTNGKFHELQVSD